MAKNKIKLVRLLTEDGRIINKSGTMDFVRGVRDSDGVEYPAGFDEHGVPHSSYGCDESGKIMFSDGSDTGYHVEQRYLSLVCMHVVHRKIHQYETEDQKVV